MKVFMGNRFSEERERKLPRSEGIMIIGLQNKLSLRVRWRIGN